VASATLVPPQPWWMQTLHDNIMQCFTTWMQLISHKFARKTNYLRGELVDTPIALVDSVVVVGGTVNAQNAFWICVNVVITMLPWERKWATHLPHIGLEPLGGYSTKSVACGQPQSVTAVWPVPSYIVGWQRHTGASSLPKATVQWCSGRTRTHESDGLLTAPP